MFISISIFNDHYVEIEPLFTIQIINVIREINEIRTSNIIFIDFCLIRAISILRHLFHNVIYKCANVQTVHLTSEPFIYPAREITV